MKGAGLKMLSRVCFCMALMAASSGSATATPYASAPIKATVVNSATGHPLEGVVVVANWETATLSKYRSGFEHGSRDVLCFIRVNLLSAVSGKDGTFSIPGWGPKEGCEPKYNTMFNGEPELVLYKPGFAPLRLYNVNTGYDTNDPNAGYLPEDDRANPPVTLRSISRWNGKTIQMTPAGSHRVIPDPQITSLYLYHRLLPQGMCFPKEERPAFLTIMQEERRLASYGHHARDEEYLIRSADDPKATEGATTQRHPYKSGGLACKAPDGYLDKLTAEADQTQAELRLPKWLDGSPEDAFELANPNPWEMPAEDLPQGEDLAPGGAGQAAIIHHVNLQYPDKPYFVRVYMTLPLAPKVMSGFTLMNKTPSTFDPTCGEFNAPRTVGVDPPYLYVSPPGLDKDGKVPAGYPTCYMLQVLGSPHDKLAELARKSPNNSYYSRRATYDSATRTYLITEQLLYRNQWSQVKVPEYIEIEAPAGAVITTDLKPTANPRRWLLPNFTREIPSNLVQPSGASLAQTNSGAPDWNAPFTVRVTMPEAGASEAAAQSVPVYMEGVPGFEDAMKPPAPGEPPREYQIQAGPNPMIEHRSAPKPATHPAPPQ